MTLVHIVLFQFRSDVSEEHKQTFVTELKKLKHLSCVKAGRLLVGGPSVTDPIERSKGFQIALVSYHENREALAEYQASDEHHRVTSTYLFPYKEDLVRFDFEVDEEDEYICQFPLSSLGI
ncbi:stress responsive A/B barrel domain protein [Aspergillus bombycis]|uniref:Stress responsive A/B barrel domain protein n=1 Tax=Aspergillus bombycis TaxID=109264 RepID=A0A1F7ZV30_9EURO|nr:stress responsive A/B barrel domain protein [Aspergillus bombycis]OGM43312.1 stress responsive A/B barrel domain protein [Aspergillus bombycis]